MAGARHSKEDNEHLKQAMGHVKALVTSLKAAGAPDEDDDAIPDELEAAAKAITLDDQSQAVRSSLWRAYEKALYDQNGKRLETAPAYCDTMHVYDDYAIVRCGLVFYKVPYTLEDAGAVVAPLAEWQRVEQDWKPSYSVKSLDVASNRIGGYAVLWGNKTTTDLEGEYFTPETDFYLDTTGPKRPMIYDHARSGGAIKSRPKVGFFDTAIPDDVGMWVEGELDKRHKYLKGIQALIQSGALGMSSDSAPHLVQRKRTGKATELLTWPLFGVSLTVSPMEPRMIPVEALKSAYRAMGLDFDFPASPEPEVSSEGATAQRDATRARRISLELSLLELT